MTANPFGTPDLYVASRAEGVDPFLKFWCGDLTPMEAIERRHSVRSYTDKPLPDAHVEALQAALDDVNEEAGIGIQLVIDEPEAFGGFKSRLVRFSGVKNYLALIGPEWKGLDEVLGYYGEKVVLLAQSLGLNTCWVGGTFKVVNGRYRIDLGEKLSGVIALGYGADQGKPHVSKAPSAVCRGYDEAPAWMRAGVDAALLAPTALNQQKFSFALDGERDGVPLVKASTKRGAFTKMDLGIAECHFTIGVGDASFAWVDRD